MSSYSDELKASWERRALAARHEEAESRWRDKLWSAGCNAEANVIREWERTGKLERPVDPVESRFVRRWAGP